jgi:DNA-binding transcriptional regulator YdaS (Cro superfamily)
MKAAGLEATVDRYSAALSAALDGSPLTTVEIAERIGVNYPNVISQWKGGGRPVPARHAAKLAALLGVRPESISAAYARLSEEGCLPAYTDVDAVPPGHVLIDRLHGFGRENAPSYAVLPMFVAEMKVGKTPIEHVRWVLQPTGAMSPTILQGALVLIDSTKSSHSEVVDGGLYAYELYGRPYVRRIVFGRDSWSLCGHDASSERVVLKSGDLDDLHIHGAVLGWL